MIKRLTLSLFSLIFALSFLIVLVLGFSYQMILLHNQKTAVTALLLLFFSAIIILFFIAAYRFFNRLSASALKKVTIILFTLMLLIEGSLIIAFHAILPPAVDGGHTYAEALYLLAHHHASHAIYLKVYPNNIPVALLQYGLFRMFSWIDLSNYMVISRGFCAIVLNISIYFSWKLVRQIFDEKMAALLLLLTLTCFPLFFYILYFYTDTATLMFPVLLLYLGYLYSRSMKMRYMFLFGLLLGIGDQIRPNLILMLPALAIYMLFVLKFKKVLWNVALILIMIAAIGISANGVEARLGYHQNPALSMPDSHWVMLGLSPNGGYNKQDYERTRQEPTQSAKKQADAQQIQLRIKQAGPMGLTRLWGIKLARTWGIGAHGYYWYTHLTTQPTKAYQYLFNHKRQLIVFVIQAFYIVDLFFLILSSIQSFRTRVISLNLLIQICLIGNLLFYTFVWEAEPRYSLLFSPFILIGAIFGFSEFMQLLDGRTGVKTSPATARNGQLILASLLLLAVILISVQGHQSLAGNRSAQRSYVVDQVGAAGKSSAKIDQSRPLTQTFLATHPFTHLAIKPVKKSGSAIYQFSVTESRTGKLLFVKKFTSSQVKVNQFKTFVAHKELAGQNEPYQLTIKQIKGSPGAGLVLRINGKGYEQRDLYPDGRLIQDGLPTKKQDLQFKVYSVDHKPYLSNLSYWLLFAIPSLMLLAYAIEVSVPRKARKLVSLEATKSRGD
ncbi:MAG: glycosyltransferase family 39 protein [Sporolactobacillus sp.]